MTPTLQRLATAGRMFYGIAIVAFGLLHIGYADFVTRIAPWWPAWIPGRPLWAYIIGALLIGAGGAILLNMRTATVATLLAAGLLLSFLLLGVPLMAGDRLLGGAWTVAFKALALCGGALLIARKTGAVGAWFFAAFLTLCGIQHFIFIDFVATLVPSWIPGAY